MEKPPARIAGEVINVIHLQDLDWEYPNKPLGSLRAWLLYIEVDPLPVWSTFTTRLEEQYVGADLNVTVTGEREGGGLHKINFFLPSSKKVKMEHHSKVRFIFIIIPFFYHNHPFLPLSV